jgi:AMMECR1 domain-containing protein
MAGMAFLCMTALLGMVYALTDDPGDALSYHFGFQGIIVRELEQDWPASNLLLPDLPRSYNYAAHLWVLGASRMAGLPPDMLVAHTHLCSSAAVQRPLCWALVGACWLCPGGSPASA